MLFKLETPEHQQSAMQSVAEVILWLSFDAAKEMAGSSHTPACCVSKPRSSLEAGMKQLRAWLEYACGVTEMLLYSSLGERCSPKNENS